PQLVQQVVPCSVHLEVHVAPKHPSVLTLGTERMGSGTLVAEDMVLTVNYITLGAAAVTVTGPHGRRAKGEVVARDFDSGLALVKIPRGLGPPAPLGEAAAAVPGQPVFVLASATPTARRVRPGVLTEVGPFDAAWEYMLDRALKASAPNPGFGGGALCDLQARMLGVVSLSLAEVARASLAVPVDLYRGHRDELLQHGRVLSRPPRAWLGLFSQGGAGGLQVVAVIPGSPAARAGVREGDLLIGLDVIRLGSRREFYTELWKHRPGGPVLLSLLRGETPKAIEVVAGDRAEFYR
ncbi:MAG: S1C family serine protease, partial [candidate division NC10 bacterium]|nr:S1C family serine protease [candidate division NC10 bacterium]